MSYTNAVEAYGTYGYNTYTLEQLNAERVSLSVRLANGDENHSAPYWNEMALICRRLAVVRYYSDLLCNKENN